MAASGGSGQGGLGGGFAKARVCRRSSHEGKIRNVVIAARLPKNCARDPGLRPGPAPDFFGLVAHGVEGECQQIEADQKRGQVLLSVAETVLEVIAAGLEHVEGLVLDLPSGATAGGEFGDVVASDRQSVMKLLR